MHSSKLDSASDADFGKTELDFNKDYGCTEMDFYLQPTCKKSEVFHMLELLSLIIQIF